MKMKAVRYYVIGLIWLPVIALAAWWAGFMPFPTRPEEIGYENNTFDGSTGSDKGFRLLISASKAREKAKVAPYGLGQWYCNAENKEACHIYEVREEPFYGLANPAWVLTASEPKSNGSVAVALYGTYAACMWNEERRQKAEEEDRVSYDRWATEHHIEIDPSRVEYYSCDRMPT
jgi:hypothetical protein